MALLHLSTIQRVPKTVTLGPHFTPAELTEPESEDLLDLLEMIEHGKAIPPMMYRRRHNDTPDKLLSDDGFMHLHLGGQDSDTLVYLMQFEHEVVLVKIAGHIYLHPDKRSALKVLSEADKRRASLRDKVKIDAAAKAEAIRKQARDARLEDALLSLKKPKK